MRIFWNIQTEKCMDLSYSFKIMAAYNQRMNDKLIKVCQQLSQAQLNASTGAFFPSILDHWNHILFGDLIMLQRLVDNDFIQLQSQVPGSLPVAKSVDDKFADNLEQLSALRTQVDAIFVAFTQGLSDETLDKTVRYRTTEGQDLERDLAAFCMHLFNHQTHHRGQITCLLSQCGLDYGSTDLPVVVPGLENG